MSCPQNVKGWHIHFHRTLTYVCQHKAWLGVNLYFSQALQCPCVHECVCVGVGVFVALLSCEKNNLILHQLIWYPADEHIIWVDWTRTLICCALSTAELNVEHLASCHSLETAFPQLVIRCLKNTLKLISKTCFALVSEKSIEISFRSKSTKRIKDRDFAGDRYQWFGRPCRLNDLTALDFNGELVLWRRCQWQRQVSQRGHRRVIKKKARAHTRLSGGERQRRIANAEGLWRKSVFF